MHNIRNLVLLLALLLAGHVTAQELTVKSFAMAANEIISRQNQRLDLAGQPCALLKIQMIDQLEKVEGNVVGKIIDHGNEKWVYVTDGTKQLRLHPKNHLSFMLTTADHGVDHMEGNRVYELRLTDNSQKSSGTQTDYAYLKLWLEPKNALVTIDGNPSEIDPEDGSLNEVLRFGQHVIVAQAPGYLTRTDTIDFRAEQTMNITLKRQASNMVTIRCATSTAMIYVNNEPHGQGECTLQLSPRTYLVKAVLDGYEAKEQPITVTGKEDQLFTIPALRQLFGTLNVSYKPSGSRIVLDGQLRGTTPTIIKDLPAGRHHVLISKDGYASYENDAFMVEPDDETRLTGQLQRQSAQQAQAARQTQKTQKSRSSQSSPAVAFGVRAGLNMATTAFDDKYSGTGSVSKFHLGVTMDVRLTDVFYFSTGLLYSAKGYKYDDDTISEEGSATFVDIPLLASFRLPLGSSVALQPSVGPYIAMGIGGDIDGEKNHQSYSTKFSDHFSSFDYGLQIGAQLIISDHFNFGASYQAGMADYRNRNMMISLGYNF